MDFTHASVYRKTKVIMGDLIFVLCVLDFWHLHVKEPGLFIHITV